MSETNASMSIAIEAWWTQLGPDAVRDDPATLDQYGRSSSATPRRPAVVLLPSTAEQVAEIVRTAARFRAPIYPISTGKNWGYGDSCAVGAGQAILDLRRLNRILDIDAELGVAVVEPGVTQRQLADHLEQIGAPWWVDCTGSAPETSLIGTIVERGFGHTPNGNRFQNCAGMEVVLGTGETICTGFGRYPEALTRYLFPYGLGPYFDGLFTQSNFGVVTKLGVWLVPKPEQFLPFVVLFEETPQLLAALTPIRRLKAEGILRSIPHIGNDMRVISGHRQFPRSIVPSGARLTDDVRAAMRRELGIGAWSMSCALYGSSAQVRTARRELLRALRPTGARVRFITSASLALGGRVAGWMGRFGGGSLGRLLTTANALSGMHSGRPTGYFLRGSYWRNRRCIPDRPADTLDPAADGCGIIWLSPVVPFRAQDVKRLNDALEALLAQFGFDYFVTFSMLSERVLAGVVTIAFDAEDEQEAARAAACHRAAQGLIAKLGYPPYRVGVDAMSQLADCSEPSFWATARKIKDALDPAGVIAPGRYEVMGAESRGDASAEERLG